MKKSMIYLAFFVSLSLPIAIVHSQDCEGYYPMKTGSVMEITSYNEKGKLQMVSEYTVKSVDGSGDNIKLTMHCESKDEKGKSVVSSDYDALCEHGTFSVSMKNMISAEQLKAWEKMDVSVTADNLELPSSPLPGQQLKDAHMTIDVSTNGMKMPGMTMDITNRKVESLEMITTPAGTFDCIKISYNIHMKYIFGMDMRAIEWYSKNNGMIRSESYKGDKLKAYSEMTKISK